MNLKSVVDRIDYLSLINIDDSAEISGVSSSSKEIFKNCIFTAIKGIASDGHDFAAEAYEKGACVLVVEKKINDTLPQIIVSSSKDALISLADIFYPPLPVNIFAVTGTNGKTTVAYLIKYLFEANNDKCCYIGTLGYSLGDKTVSLANTTPDYLTLKKIIHKNYADGVKNFAIEASSHAIEQGRLGYLKFAAAGITNISQDHLDYHGTMDAYLNAKLKIIKNIKEDGFFLINKDDAKIRGKYDELKNAVRSYAVSVNEKTEISASDIKFSYRSTSFKINFFDKEEIINTNLIGRFNVYNILFSFGLLKDFFDLEFLKNALKDFKGAAGRFEKFKTKDGKIIIVDYAHTPDALLNVLKTLNEVKENKIITVFGCGGDRDKTKRPLMGSIASEMSDFIFITNDNPRGENPEDILKDILSGINKTNFQIELDRAEAVREAVNLAAGGDIVLVAGKGHEEYQIIGEEKIFLSDRKIVSEIAGE